MSLDQEVEALRKVPFFANIDPARLKLMAFASERLTFKPGQMLCKQGDVGDSAYIILEGEAEVFFNGGEKRVIAKLGVNDIVGEIAILCDVPRTANVEAGAKGAVTLKLTKELFLRMAHEFPDMALEVMRVLAHRMEGMIKAMRDVQSTKQ